MAEAGHASKDNEAEETDAKPSGPPSDQEKKANALLEQAAKKESSASSFMGKIFGGASKFEEAADLYAKAGNLFKVAKNFAAAGKAYCDAARLHKEQLDSAHEAATKYADAAAVYKKIKPTEAVTCYQHAIEIYTGLGRFSLAAKYHMNIAEIYENEIVNLELAITSYEQAADFYRGEDSNASANKCVSKVAHMCAQLHQYQKASEIFEEVGRHCLDSGLLKYSAKDHFFKALICIFCQQASDVQTKMEEYKNIHPAFEGTREQKLIEALHEAFEEGLEDKFAQLIEDYDSISRIDNWLTAQLLVIKKKIGQPDDIN